MELDYSNRHVVVTGGTGALGAAVVELLINAGATIHIGCCARETRRMARDRTMAGNPGAHGWCGGRAQDPQVTAKSRDVGETLTALPERLGSAARLGFDYLSPGMVPSQLLADAHCRKRR